MTGAGSGGQGPPDGTDAEEAERCPICLGVLAGGVLAMPDSCCHVFCLRCLLTWAELQAAPSCPVDRRPFTNVYRWDGNLSCVQVPVRKRATQPEAESCCCRNPEQKVCLKSKPARRPRRQKAERTADAKTKGLVRKCNDDDPSSLSRKKVRGIECCTWSPSSCVSLSTTSTQDIAEPVWLAEDVPCDAGFKQCKTQAQDCPWLSPAAPIPANGSSRQRFLPSGWNNSSVPAPFTSTSLFNPGHFVFQGVVCAITCPKGGDKRGGRASTSKAPTKEAKSLPSRRSGRNSKSQQEAPASEPSSPPQSSSPDSDSSTGQAAKPGRASQAPAKRKRVTNRKAGGKRKAAARKKKSPEVINSPSASEEEEEEEEGDGCDNEEEEEEADKSDQEEDLNNSEQQQSDAEGNLNEDQDEFNSADGLLSNDVGQDSDETQEEAADLKPEEGDDGLSCPSDSAPNSPGSCSDGDQNKMEDDEPASPASSRERDGEKNKSSSPLLDNQTSPHCDQQAVDMDVCPESEKVNNEESSKEVMAESCEDSPPPSAAESEDNSAIPDSKPAEDADLKMLGSELEPSFSSGEATKDDSLSKDDNKVVPMDCSSPVTEHGSSSSLELPKDSSASAAVETPGSQSAKDESNKDQPERERSQERKNGRQRRSRFHSPTSTWSPKRDSRRDPSRRSRSRSRERDGSPPSSRSSRARSREKDRDGERDYSRRERSRERRRRRSRSRSRSRSKSRSRSRSRSRTRSYRRGPSSERPSSREHSPQRKERRGGWRSGQGGEGSRHHGGVGRFENGEPAESSPERQGWSENPDWVTEKSRGEADKNRDFGFGGGSRWEDRNSGGNRESQGRGGRGGYEHGRGAGRGGGGGGRSFYNQQEETPDNRWQPRNNFSGTGNNSGNDAYSRFNENRGSGRRKEPESGESMRDRSGWSSASSWAVRRTLPADVQDYYSKRERGGPGGWNRQEEEQPPAADPPKSEPALQAVPGNAPVPVMNVVPAQLNVLQHHFPMQGPRGALPVTLQPAAPYAMPPPQVPVHLHPAATLLQVPAVGAQGLPPPPPPPPPMHQGSQTAAAQPDGYTTQMASTMVGYGKPGILPTPTKAGVAAYGQSAASQVLPSSTTQPGQHNKAQADSSKKEKKQQIQEKAVNEVKTAIKPYYQKNEITKEEYKEIVRKAVEKVCHSKSGEVNSSKVANLVKAYVDKYKHARKK